LSFNINLNEMSLGNACHRFYNISEMSFIKIITK